MPVSANKRSYVDGEYERLKSLTEIGVYPWRQVSSEASLYPEFRIQDQDREDIARIGRPDPLSPRVEPQLSFRAELQSEIDKWLKE